MLYAICIGLFMPLIGFLKLTALSSVISRRLTSIIGCGTILISFLCFAYLFYLFECEGINNQTVTLFSWIPVKGIDANFSLHLDHLSLLMTLIITGVGFLIHVYSIGYMEHDEDFARYFACLNFFVFSMLLLVLAANFCCYSSAGRAWAWLPTCSSATTTQEMPPQKAATKAFVINRIGDCAFLIGLLLIFYTFGTGDIEAISQQSKATSPWALRS